jgi:uncharacterized protein YqeY
MTILEQIDQDLLQALKSKDQKTTSTLRLLSAALKYERIKKMQDLTDEDVIKVLKSELKKRRESIADYTQGNRPDLAAKEQEEIPMIEKYLPAQMGEAELKAKIQAILQNMADKENSGKVMGKVMAELKGQADGSAVKKILDELLAK